MSSINKAENQLQDRLINQVKEMERQIYQLRVNAGGMIGDIAMTLNTTPRTGRLLMDGSTYDKEDYPLLWQHIVDNPGYGSTTSTTFTLKNMRGRAPVGLDSTQTEFDTLGETGGSKTHTLTLAQIPNVTGYATIHGGEGGSIIYNVGGVFSGSTFYPSGYKVPPGTTGGAHSHSNLNFSLGGGGQSHPNLQPYVVINYEVRAA